MDHDGTALVVELRQYLSSSQTSSSAPTTHLVEKLKQELNLAARVGQRLLMQLQSCERAKTAQEQDVRALQLHNARLSNENRRLAADYELLTQTLEAQDAELQQLITKLAETSLKAEKLGRAAAAARALEREVEILEDMQTQLQLQLDKGSDLTSGLTVHVQRALDELKLESIDLPSLTDSTLDDSSVLHTDTSDLHNTNGKANEKENENEKEKANKDIKDIANTDTKDIANTDININDTKDTADINANWLQQAVLSLDPPASPARPLLDAFIGMKPAAQGTPLKPALRRMHSHESVLSVADRRENPAVGLSVSTAAVTDLVAHAHSEREPSRVSARERLARMKTERKPRERHWVFTPFRSK